MALPALRTKEKPPDLDVITAGYHDGADGQGTDNGSEPPLFHKIKSNKSILALTVSDTKIYAGTQDGDLLVWLLETYELLFTIAAHRGSILCLFLSADKKLLLSSAGDAIVNIWCPVTLERLYSIYSKYDVGDVFCVVYSVELQTVYLGAQNTSIQWYDLSQRDSRPRPNLAAHPSQRNHRFFDSKGPGGVITPRPSVAFTLVHGGQDLEIDKDHIVQYAHYGYVYCMLLADGTDGSGLDEEKLISGGGDGVIKIWILEQNAGGAIRNPVSLENGDESILAMALDGSILYSGRLDGDVNVWDLDTRQLIRKVKTHTADVLSLSVGHGLVLAGGADGIAKKFNRRYECMAEWKAHDRLILASSIANHKDKEIFVTGGNDSCISIWDVSNYVAEPKKVSITSNEQLLVSLGRFLSFRTVSSKPEYTEDCRRGASWLRNLFKQFGAATDMFNTRDNRNPIVFARFKGKNPGASQGKKILFYGHYDVVAAENVQGTWNTEPFDMHGVNGYLYGRGVSDNKGPLLAALYAIADLNVSQQLKSDVIFLVEGEEECGSRGFQEAVKTHKHVIGDVDWILLANSYWLNDEIPCLTYGLRGLVQATIRVESAHPDLHSGVDGSHLINEPLKDLVALLAVLTSSSGRVNIPGFYDPILPITRSEIKMYDAISETLLRHNPDLGDTENLAASFKARWREPSLTIHRIDTSGPANSTIIPRIATASLSIRLVPDQSPNAIQIAMQALLHQTFKSRKSSNQLTIQIDHQADPWLGDPSNQIFQILEEAIMEVWGPISHTRRPSVPSSAKTLPNGLSSPKSPITSSTLSYSSDQFSPASVVSQRTNREENRDSATPAGAVADSLQKPLYIREGGSIPAIRFLEKEFNAPAAHLPCGQASDSAHLDNERFRLSNMYNSREIFKKVFRELPLR